MDELNKGWLDDTLNFYFRFKREFIEKNIEGSCLNVGCGSHLIKNAVNIDKNAENLPYKNNSFDTVILSDVIEHIKDWKKAVDESIRVSRKKVLITVPAYGWLWSNYDTRLGHFRRYKKADFDYLKKRRNLKYKISYLFSLTLPLIYLRKFGSGKTPKLPKIVDNFLYAISHLRLPFGSTLVLEIKK